MKTVWLKRNNKHEEVLLLREYPEIGAVKVIRRGSPEPWTFKSSEIVHTKPPNPKRDELEKRRKVKHEREMEQVIQVERVIADGNEHTVMGIVDAVNAMPSSLARMEPARVWKIVNNLATDIRAELTASGLFKRWIIKAKQP